MRRKELDGVILENLSSQEYWEERLYDSGIEDPDGYRHYGQQNPISRMFVKQFERESKWFK